MEDKDRELEVIEVNLKDKSVTVCEHSWIIAGGIDECAYCGARIGVRLTIEEAQELYKFMSNQFVDMTEPESYNGEVIHAIIKKCEAVVSNS